MRWIAIVFFLALAGVVAFIIWAGVPSEIFVPLIPSAVSVTFTLVLFIGFLVTLARLLSLVWARIPTVVIDSAQMDKVLAALISLGIFPAIAKYAWATFQSIMRLFPELIRMLGGSDLQADCSGRLDADSIRRCASGLANDLGRITNQLTSRIMDALNLERFPLADFVWFLISTVILVQLIASLRQRLVLDEVVTWLTSRIAWTGSSIGSIPTVTWQRIVFTALVVTSFYLGLTALLAIPLLNEKSRSQHTVDDVTKALEVYLIKLDAFPPQLPQVSLPARLPQESSLTRDSSVTSTQNLIKSESDSFITPMVVQVHEQWARIRSGADDTQRRGA